MSIKKEKITSAKIKTEKVKDQIKQAKFRINKKVSKIRKYDDGTKINKCCKLAEADKKDVNKKMIKIRVEQSQKRLTIERTAKN